MGASVSAAGGTSTAPPPSMIIIDPSPTTPDFRNGKISADPNYGFEGKRKERVSPVTKEELRSAKVPPQFRDFCAHKFIAFQKCKRDEFPFLLKCHHARHELELCQHGDYIIRMKEYERERRLLERKERKAAKAKKANVCHDE